MSRDTKRQISWYQINDSDAIARHLEKMAAKGWHLEKVGNLGWRFRRGEPRKVRYALTYFPGASIFDGALTMGQETYIDYCLAAGWEFVSSYGPMQYFRSTRPDPTPIETDEATKLQAIHGSMKKTLVFSYLMLLVAESLSLWSNLNSFRYSPLRQVSSASTVGVLLLLIVFLVYLAGILVDYFLWYFRSKRSVARGGPCAKVHTRARLWASRALLAVCALTLGCFAVEFANPGMRPIVLYSFGGILAILAVSRAVMTLLKRGGYSRRMVRGGFVAACVVMSVIYASGMIPLASHISRSSLGRREPAALYTDSIGWDWEIYADPLPVTLEDLGFSVTAEDHCTYEAEKEASLLAARGRFYQDAASAESDLPDLEYTVCRIPWGWLRGLCWRAVLQSSSAPYFRDELSPRPDGVEEIWRREAVGRYALLCEDRIILVLSGWDLTAQQMETLVRRLT